MRAHNSPITSKPTQGSGASRPRPRYRQLPTLYLQVSGKTRTYSMGYVAKCAWFRCAATRNALAATVRLGFNPVLDGKNEVSTT